MASENKSRDVFEAALKREMQRAPHSDAADCPAPEILAAYYDRSLLRSERARVDSHLVSCARCQSMMASIARADDSERSSTNAAPARGLWITTRLLAPVAVVGVVIAIAIGVRTREQRAPEVIALASPAAASKDEWAQSASAPPPESAVQGQAAPQVASAPPAGSAVQGQAAPQVASAPPAGSAMEAPRAEGFVRQDKARRKSAPSIEDSLSRRDEVSAPAQPQNLPAEVASEMRAPSAATGSTFSGATRLMAKEARMNQVSSPDGSVRWQFGSGGTIMRSGNSSPWLALHSSVTSDLIAASAPSNDVCWMVGKSGAIVRTLDGGAHWQIVKPPSRDDFTAISATDSNNATLTAFNGERFITHDGGVTWSSP